MVFVKDYVDVSLRNLSGDCIFKAIPPQRKKPLMIRRYLAGIALLSALTWLSSCDNEIESVVDTSAPEVEILSPADGDTIYSDTLIEVRISDQSEITSVTYFVDDILIAEKESSPYGQMWYAGYWAPDETYLLKVVAEDDHHYVGSSNEVSVFVDPDARTIPMVYQPRDSMNLAAVTTVTFACTPCPGATSYTLKWYCVACPCSDEWCGLKFVQSSSNQIGILINMPIPPVDLKIEWSIQARFDDEHRSDWSEPRLVFIRGAP